LLITKTSKFYDFSISHHFAIDVLAKYPAGYCALLPDQVTEFLKLRSALHKQGAILGPKISRSAFL
jgi:hypothetical protein